MNTNRQLQICLFDAGHPNRCEHIVLRPVTAEQVDGSGPVALPAGARVMMTGFALDPEDRNRSCAVAEIDKRVILLPEDATCPVFLLYLR